MVAPGRFKIMKVVPPSHTSVAQATLVRGQTKWIKHLLLSFHFTFWLARTVVFAIGLWLRFNSQSKTISKQENDRSFQPLHRS